ncbi:MAG: ABC transporter permease [Planctomycetota bacterium]|jgi:ribose transport system permease protein|nr:ABC transporter permease [Planctomycetota bacterium]
MPPTEKSLLRRAADAVGLQYIGLILANLIIILVMAAHYEEFLSPFNIEVTLMSFLPEAVMSLGMTLVIITGGIDLSISAVLPLSAIAVGMCMNRGVPWGPAIAVALAFATLIGLINAKLINVLRVHPFIVTMAMMLTLKGFNLAVTDGRTLAGFPDSFQEMGQGYLWDLVPIPMAIFAGLAAITAVFLGHNRFVRQVYSIGGNERAARLSGIRVERMRYFVYGLSSFLAGVAGVIVAAQYGSANNSYGQNAEMKVITSVAVGGASLNGGSGTIASTLLGVLFLAVVNGSFVMTGISTYWQDIVNGGMLLAAVVVGEFAFNRRQR